MGLFGIFAHGMPAYEMEKSLIGLVACESERHTADNIEKWTEDALKAVGLAAPSLLGTADGGNDFHARPCEWAGDRGRHRRAVGAEVEPRSRHPKSYSGACAHHRL